VEAPTDPDTDPALGDTAISEELQWLEQEVKGRAFSGRSPNAGTMLPYASPDSLPRCVGADRNSGWILRRGSEGSLDDRNRVVAALGVIYRPRPLNQFGLALSCDRSSREAWSGS